VTALVCVRGHLAGRVAAVARRHDPEAAGCGVSIGMPGEPEVVRPEDVPAAPGLEPHTTCGYVRDSYVRHRGARRARWAAGFVSGGAAGVSALQLVTRPPFGCTGFGMISSTTVTSATLLNCCCGIRIARTESR